MFGKFLKDKSVKNALYIGSLCTVSYFVVYLARNILSAVTPQMIEKCYTESYIGKLSSMFFVFYAVGQLINGAIGDKIKAKYMLSIGLFMAGVTNVLFCLFAEKYANIATFAYAFTGFFLAMIYGPMTKTVAENTKPIHATRCSLGYTFASFFASPVAGIFGALLIWQNVFKLGGAILIIMAIICFIFFSIFKKKVL